MKRLLVLLSFVLLLTGCQQSPKVSPVVEPSVTPDTTTVIEDTDESVVRYDLIITDQNFGVDEMYVQKGERLVISLRNQLEQPVNITIDQLPIHTENVEKGEMIEVEIPTNIAGEFEVYSSFGDQRENGFSTLLTIEE